MTKRVYLLFVFLAVAAFLSCSRGEKEAAVSSSDAAPSFVLSTVKNERVGLNDYRGKVVLLEFFASWCPPCQATVPDVKSIYEKYKDKGFVVLAVSIDEGPTAVTAVGNFVKDFNIPYPVLLDNGKVSGKYEVISIPTSFIIDKQGKIKNKHIGLRSDFAETLSKEIEPLL